MPAEYSRISRCTYQVCTSKPYSVAVYGYMPAEYSRISRYTYPVCTPKPYSVEVYGYMPAEYSRISRCTYPVCTSKPYSVALSVYIPPEKWPKGPFWPGYVQETGIPECLRCTYLVCTVLCSGYIHLFSTVVHGGGRKGTGACGAFGPLEAVPPRRLHRRQAPVLLPLFWL